MRKEIEQHIGKIEELLYHDSQIAIKKARAAVDLAKQYNQADLMGITLMLQGTVEVNRGKIYEGTLCLNEAIVYASSVNDSMTVGRCYNVLGTIHNHQGAYEDALDCYLKYYDAVVDLDFPRKTGSALNNIGEIYRLIGDYPMAIQHYEDALNYVINEKNGVLHQICLLNIAESQIEMGNIDAAKEILFDLLNRNLESQNVIIGFTNHLLGRLYSRNEKNKELAVKYYEEAMKMVVEGNNSIENLNIVFDYAKHYHQYHDDDKALVLLEKCLKESEGVESSNFVLEVSEIMKEIYIERDYQEGIQKILGVQLKTFADLRKIQSEMRSNSIKRHVELKNLEERHRETERNNKKLNMINQSMILHQTELESELKILQIVNEIGRDITSTSQLSDIVDLLYARLQTILEIDVIGLAIHDNDDMVMMFRGNKENESQEAKRYPLKDNMMIAKALYEKKRLHISDLDKEYSTFYTKERYKEVQSRKYASKSILLEPLMFEDDCIGVLTIQSETPNKFDEKLLSIGNIIASFTAIALKNYLHKNALLEEIDEKEEAKAELMRVNDLLEQRANLDGLTAVYNKRHFNKLYKEAWEAAKASQHSLGMLIIDIDDFKNYNDNYGHLKGDDIIKIVANALKESFPHGITARFGGEEFVILLEKADKLEVITSASLLLEAIRVLKEPHAYSDITDIVTVSVGAGVTVPSAEDNLEDFFAYVDGNMYKAKDLGKDQYYMDIE